MPISVGRGNSLQNIQHYAITDNPVFHVKVRSLSTNYEQPANGKSRDSGHDDLSKKFKMGEIVTGKEEDSDKVHTGKIIKINKEKSTLTIIDHENEKKIVLDIASCQKEKKSTDKGDYELPFTSENYIMSLEEFIQLN